MALDGKHERAASRPRKRKQSLIEMASKDTTDRDETLLSSPLSLNCHQEPVTEPSLLSCFGYFEASKSNIWSLMRGVSGSPFSHLFNWTDLNLCVN